jgi:hypothetical protein
VKVQLRERDVDSRHAPTKAQRGLELATFVLASLVGIYGIGKGLAGFYVRGQEISLLWLAVTGVTFFVLFAQMGRVHDTWPHRSGKAAPEAPAETLPMSGSPHDEPSEVARKTESR